MVLRVEAAPVSPRYLFWTCFAQILNSSSTERPVGTPSQLPGLPRCLVACASRRQSSRVAWRSDRPAGTPGGGQYTRLVNVPARCLRVRVAPDAQTVALSSYVFTDRSRPRIIHRNCSDSGKHVATANLSMPRDSVRANCSVIVSSHERGVHHPCHHPRPPTLPLPAGVLRRVRTLQEFCTEHKCYSIGWVIPTQAGRDAVAISMRVMTASQPHSGGARFTAPA